MANTFSTYTTGSVYKDDAETKLQERLAYQTNWKECCKVKMSNTGYMSIPYMSTVPAAGTLTRDSGITWAAHAATNEFVSLLTSKYAASTIDKAALLQLSFNDQMELAIRFGQELNEEVEASVLGDYEAWTDFDNGVVTANAEDNANITITQDIVDDVVGAMVREIREANGQSLMSRNGAFVIWRVTDFELLEKWARSVGYTSADDIIVNGGRIGMRYMGVSHYWSNKHTANHVFGGVKGLHHVGIVSGTYGKIDEVPFPASTTNLYSIGITSRLDYGVKTPTGYAPLLYDFQVA